MIASTDGEGKVTRHAYDAANRVISETNPLNETTQYEYDAVGRRTKVTFANGDCSKPLKWISLAVIVLGLVLLAIGLICGGMQVFIHYQFYSIHARKVSLDALYAVLFFWCFWCSTSLSYCIAGELLKYKRRIAAIAIIMLAICHLSVVGLVVWEIR